MIVVESLEASSSHGLSDAPKERVRLELQLFPKLGIICLPLTERLGERYLNPALRQLRVQGIRISSKATRMLKNISNSLSVSVSRQTILPKSGQRNFLQGLSDPISIKLTGVAFINYTNVEMVPKLTIQLDTSYLIRQELGSFSNSGPDIFFKTLPKYEAMQLSNISNALSSGSQLPHQSTEMRGKISQEVRDYRKSNNLCMFDGVNQPTHLYQRFFEKLAKEDKPPPSLPASQTSEFYRGQIYRGDGQD